MEYRKLGRTDMEASVFCLGTMLFNLGETRADSAKQMDMAVDHGINFFDVAEMYPVNPLAAETTGDSERVIGEWLQKSGKRGDLIIATKVSGEGYMNVRNGAPISRATLTEAVEASLKRLKTDYIDIYQLHWPNRGSYHFRKYWEFDASGQNTQETLDSTLEILQTLQEFVDAGKIRHIGLSNDSAWGTMQFLNIAEANGLPRVVTMQNEYSLINRMYDTDMAELSHNEDVGLITYSPLATGLLSGKYSGDVTPKGSRRARNDSLGGRLTADALAASDAYVGIARKHGIDPVHMALAFCVERPFMASVIFGASNIEQLAHILKGVDLRLNAEINADILAAFRKYPRPM
ncbi:MAG: aldo/keto reductase [Rhodobacteraceae bacterium]|nr:aldo/keto reductase [Paracoccaceae bacterium]